MSGQKIQGFNTEIAIGSHRFHIQTELVSGRIVTLIFENGAVVGGKKTELVGEGVSKNEETAEILKTAMMEQHKLMVENIKNSMKPAGEEISEEEKIQKDKYLIKKFLEDWAEE
jgi:alpha-D-ribose 1-methylphosphonate 5-triphosphate synthase subunit PhnH